jgi:hypothetical protein
MFFHQHDILPSVFGQMIQNAGTDGTATDNDNSRLFFHWFFSFGVEKILLKSIIFWKRIMGHHARGLSEQ